jgi:hypothetical protein
MTRLRPLGIPGTISDTSLALPPGLTYDQVRNSLRLIGRIGRAISWLAADCLMYAETQFGEGKFSQLAEELGWAPHTLQNVLAVGRAWPPARRRPALDFAHHAALVSLTVEEQEEWASRIEEGDTLPNGERKRWSIARLREALRGRRAALGLPPVYMPPRSPIPLAVGDLVIFPGIEGEYRITEIRQVADGVRIATAKARA